MHEESRPFPLGVRVDTKALVTPFSARCARHGCRRRRPSERRRRLPGAARDSMATAREQALEAGRSVGVGERARFIAAARRQAPEGRGRDRRAVGACSVVFAIWSRPSRGRDSAAHQSGWAPPSGGAEELSMHVESLVRALRGCGRPRCSHEYTPYEPPQRDEHLDPWYHAPRRRRVCIISSGVLNGRRRRRRVSMKRSGTPRRSPMRLWSL